MMKFLNINRGERESIRFDKGRENKQQFNQFFLFVFIMMVIILFVVLIFRLFQLTIVKGEYYKRLSEENRIKEITINPKRGSIIDRKGFVVVKNEPSEDKENNDRLTSKRYYKSAEDIAHLVGYIQTADKTDIKNDICINKIKLGDKIGKKGIEKLYECDLRGKHGKKLVETDAKGKQIKTISIINPIDGKDIQLSFDWELQKKAYELIKDNKAVIIASKPKTGEILVFVSSPSFSPQDFENGNVKSIKKYFDDENKPLFNRITKGSYPPGSIFKLAIATGALEEGKITEKTLIEDTGTIKAGPQTFGNWYFLEYGKVEGMVNILKAIKRSNDIYFYKAGERLGVENIKKWAEILGYGEKTGIGFEESTGSIPSPFWKEEVIKEQWYLGDTYNLSIGQGYLLSTPLQVNQATSVFANNGYLCPPEVLKISQENVNCTKLPISKKTMSLIQEGMEQACEPKGTGWPFFDFKPRVACKTGTAESFEGSGIPHAWFTMYAPVNNPEIVITVLIEEGGQGSDVAAPIAKQVLKAYFERKE